MTKKQIIPILNFLTLLIMIGINIFAMVNLFGFSTKEISDSIPTLLMPSGFVFSIVWTVIYLGVIVYTLYQLFAANNETVRKINLLVLFSNLLNALWIISFHGKLYLISTVIIILLNVVLYLISRRVTEGNILTKYTFNIYYGWITVAMFVSIFSYISSIEKGIYNSLVLRIATAIAIILLMILVFIKRKNYGFSFTVIFALIGVLVKQIVDYDVMYLEIVIVTIIAILSSLTVTILSIGEETNPESEIVNEVI